MKCFKCGFSQPDDSIFCEKCGAKLDQPKTVRCTVCGHEQIDGAFCDICGKPTKGVSTEQPVTVRPFADRWEEPQKAKKRPVEKAKANASRKPLIVGICCVSVCILAAGGVLLYTIGNKGKDNVKTKKNSAAEVSEAGYDSSVGTTVLNEIEMPETTTTKATTTVTTKRETTTTKKEEPKPEAASEDWIDEYIEQAKAFEKDTHKIPNDATLTYILLYLNGDDIPELLMQSSLVTSELYTVANGHAKLLHYGDTPRQGCFITANESAHTYAYYDMPNGFNETYSVIKLNDDGSTEIESQFGTRDGEYYIDDKSATKQEVENCRISLIGMIQRPQYTSAAELETELNKFRKQGTPAKKKVEVIPATKLCEMTKGELLDKIGDSYRVSWEEYSGTGGYIYGITSDEYFPNVLISLYGQNVKSPEDVQKLFDEIPSSSVIDIGNISIFEGGLIGSDVRVGDTYESMLMKIDALSGVGVYQPVSTSIIDGHPVELWFEGVSEINELKGKYGTNVVDLNNTSGSKAKCVSAGLRRVTGPQGVRAKITGDGVALRIAPYADAVNIWNIEEGAEVYVGGECVDAKGEHWIEVGEYRTKDSGVWKKGYVHAEYVKILD